ncbi:unnamed protein product [Caretta caretta]
MPPAARDAHGGSEPPTDGEMQVPGPRHRPPHNSLAPVRDSRNYNSQEPLRSASGVRTGNETCHLGRYDPGAAGGSYPHGNSSGQWERSRAGLEAGLAVDGGRTRRFVGAQVKC